MWTSRHPTERRCTNLWSVPTGFTCGAPDEKLFTLINCSILAAL